MFYHKHLIKKRTIVHIWQMIHSTRLRYFFYKFHRSLLCKRDTAIVWIAIELRDVYTSVRNYGNARNYTGGLGDRRRFYVKR